jgi:hypothetical protein
MTVSVLNAFRDEFSRQAAKPLFIDQQTNGISFGQYSQWFDLAPSTKPNVLAAYVKFVYTVTGTPTAQTHADQLDILLGQVQVAAASNVVPRSQTITRRLMEDVEQITFDTNFLGTSTYPRAAPQTSAGSYTAQFYVPIGGPAAALRLLLPSSTNAYTTAAVTINSITVYAIEGGNDTVITFQENNTPSLGTSIQSLKNYVPAAIAPDVLIMVGDTATTITQLFIADQNGQISVSVTDMDSVQYGMVAITPRTGPLGNTAIPGGSLSIDIGIALQGGVLTTFQAAFASATTHDVAAIQYAGSGNVPENTPQETPAPPAVDQTGALNAAGIPVVKGSKMAGKGPKSRFRRSGGLGGK